MWTLFPENLAQRGTAQDSGKTDLSELHNPDAASLRAADSTRAREEERRRIAQDLHDDLGGQLTGIKMHLAVIQKRFDSELGQHLIPQLAALNAMIDQTIDSTRRLASHLRPPILDLGLIAALEWLAEDFNRRSDTRVHLSSQGCTKVLSQEEQIGVFRICQEALNNALKHAHATIVQVKVNCDGERLVLEIIDNGHGFKETDCRRSDAFGLSGMTDRATHLGGTLAIESTLDSGTTIRLTLPS